jgi:hypothetical protein
MHFSFLDMVESSAKGGFPPSFYSPPSNLASVQAPMNIGLPSLPFIPSSSSPSPAPPANTPSSASNVGSPPLTSSAINLRLGNFEVGTGGVYRTSSANNSGPTIQIDSTKVKEGLNAGLMGARDLGTGLLGRMRQGVEARRTGSTPTPQ